MEINKSSSRFKVGMALIIIAFEFPFGVLLGPLIGTVLGNLLGTQLGNGLGLGLAMVPGLLVGYYVVAILSNRRQSSLKPYLTNLQTKEPWM